MKKTARYVKVVVLQSVLSLLLFTTAAAQTELEYKYELGCMMGGVSYMGDANPGAFFANTRIAGGLVGRWNINPRMALKGDLVYGRISGTASDLQRIFGDIEGQSWSFDNSLIDASCAYEINFWGFGTGKSYKGTHRIVPHLQMGLGGTFCNDTFTLNFPLGVGVRCKLAERWNVGLDWAMHISLSDRLDGITDPFKMESGFLKNTDTYSLTMLYISYDLVPKLRKCNN